MTMPESNKHSSIRLIPLVLILVSSILSIGSWHIAAQFGLQSIFYLIFASIFFMVPVAFVSAELASGYQSFGGIFMWVKDAFGMKLAVLCSWLLWVSNIVWYPTVFTFMSMSLIYYINPPLSENRVLIFVLMNLLFWLGNGINIIGYKFNSRTLSLSVVLSMIIPAGLLIGLGAFAFYLGVPGEINFVPTAKEFFPIDQKSAILLTGLLLGFTGLEMAMVHYEKVSNPIRDFPRAILLAMLLLIVVSILGTLGISHAIPKSQINLITDSLDAIYYYLSIFKMDSFMPVINILISLGTWIAMSAYLAEPSKTFLQAVKSSGLSRNLEKSSSDSIPIRIMILQGILVSLISIVFSLFKDLTDFYWMLTDLASQLYLLIYIVMFLAVIKIKVIKKSSPISIIPFGNKGVVTLGFIGCVLSVFCFMMGCLPPNDSTISYPILYSLGVVSTIAMMTLLPLIGLKFKRIRHAQLSKKIN